jgi:hypothetical protein
MIISDSWGRCTPLDEISGLAAPHVVLLLQSRLSSRDVESQSPVGDGTSVEAYIQSHCVLSFDQKTAHHARPLRVKEHDANVNALELKQIVPTRTFCVRRQAIVQFVRN